jgi:hypothetical protein
MTIVYRMLPDGGFVAGDTATERTSYAYPTSVHAERARRNAERVAAMMMLEHQISPSDITRAYDRRNWTLLNETRFA